MIDVIVSDKSLPGVSSRPSTRCFLVATWRRPGHREIEKKMVSKSHIDFAIQSPAAPRRMTSGHHDDG